jgi:hypothetical protein
MCRLDSGLRAGLVELLQPGVPEGPNHLQECKV